MVRDLAHFFNETILISYQNRITCRLGRAGEGKGGGAEAGESLKYKQSLRIDFR